MMPCWIAHARAARTTLGGITSPAGGLLDVFFASDPEPFAALDFAGLPAGGLLDVFFAFVARGALDFAGLPAGAGAPP